MASAQTASLRLRPGYAPPPTQPTPTFTPAPFTPPTIPDAPSTGVVNPANAGQEAYLTSLLDPKNASYLGNKARPDLAMAGSALQSGLQGFGDYSFTTDANGIVQADKKNIGQPGSKYRDAYAGANAQANAAGMLFSRTAHQAIGDAWNRLGQAERGVFNQYAGQVNGILSGLASDFTSVSNQLFGLYGQDVQYALDNPVLAPDAAGDSGSSGTTGTLGPPDQPGGTHHWSGRQAPNVKSLSKAWGVPVSSIKIRPTFGNRWIADVKS